MKKYALFIGIDISKKWIDVSLTLDGQKTKMIHQRFSNQRKGFTKMLSWIKTYAQLHQLDRCWLFCMEHTGLYGIPLNCFLEEQCLDYVLETPLRIKRSLGLKRGKDDKADSQDIARYAYLHREELKISKLPSKDLSRLKNLVAFRARLIKYRSGLKVAAGEMKKFIKKDLLDDIISDTDTLLEVFNQKIKKVEKQMKQIVKENQEIKKVFDLATSVKGVGLIIGTHLIVHTNCFQGFENARQFAAYAGVAPFGQSSGTSLNVPPKVSHLANKKTKALLSNATMTVIQHDKELKAYYERKIAEGKNKFSVLNAIKNKLLGRIWAVVQRGTPYVELRNYA